MIYSNICMKYLVPLPNLAVLAKTLSERLYIEGF